MSTSNPRKRAAPSSAPDSTLNNQPVQTTLQQTQQQMPQIYPQRQSNDSLVRWNGLDSTGFPPSFDSDSSFNFAQTSTTQSSQQPSLRQHQQQPSNILTRRQPNQALIPATSRADVDAWAQLSDANTLGQPHQGDGTPQETTDIATLEDMAQKAKSEAQRKRKTIPPFVQKLSSFLEEHKNEELIHWSHAGDSFVVEDEDEFARRLIPELFKHNNYASFVRQLNMYGFHKRVGLSDNSMRASERKNKSPSEYYNPYFQRGHPDLLWLITKPKAKSKNRNSKSGEGDADSDEEAVLPADPPGQNADSQFDLSDNRALPAPPDNAPLQKKEMTLIREELSKVRNQQKMILNQINRLQKDNHDLYQQAMMFQSQHERHQNSINAILNFLANVFRKTLEDQGNTQNVNDIISSMISNQSGQQQSSHIVDLGDIFSAQTDHSAGLGGSHKRARGLLPPVPGYEAPASNTNTPSFEPVGQQHNQEMGHITELPENSPADTPPNLRQELESNPQERMMKIIHDHNATNTSGMDLPEAAELVANTPETLSNDQRSKLVNLMARSSASNSPMPARHSPSQPSPRRLSHQSASGQQPGGADHSSQGLPSLSPITRSPQLSPPSLQQISSNNEDMDRLQRMQRQQESRISELGELLGPLSPSGHIPGLGDQEEAYFDPPSNIDFDQFLDNAAFLNSDDGINGDASGNDFDFNLVPENKVVMNGATTEQDNTPSPAGTEEIPRYDLQDRGNDNKRRRV